MVAPSPPMDGYSNLPAKIYNFNIQLKFTTMAFLNLLESKHKRDRTPETPQPLALWQWIISWWKIHLISVLQKNRWCWGEGVVLHWYRSALRLTKLTIWNYIKEFIAMKCGYCVFHLLYYSKDLVLVKINRCPLLPRPVSVWLPSECKNMSVGGLSAVNWTWMCRWDKFV